VWKARLRFSAGSTVCLTAMVFLVDATDGRPPTSPQGLSFWLGGSAFIFAVSVVTMTVVMRPHHVNARGSYVRYQAELIRTRAREAEADVRAAAGVPAGTPLTRDQWKLVREALAARRNAERIRARSRR
jgi:hypothetical protein